MKENPYVKMISKDCGSANLDALLNILEKLLSKYSNLTTKTTKSGNFADGTFYEGSTYAIACLIDDIRRAVDDIRRGY